MTAAGRRLAAVTWTYAGLTGVFEVVAPRG
jgi:hypothetical protein